MFAKHTEHCTGHLSLRKMIISRVGSFSMSTYTVISTIAESGLPNPNSLGGGGGGGMSTIFPCSRTSWAFRKQRGMNSSSFNTQKKHRNDIAARQKISN